MHNPAVQAALAGSGAADGARASVYEVRAAKQAALLKLPTFPTTTIGSFPQIGVSDIHPPNIAPPEHVVALMRKAAQRVPSERLRVNPDCGLQARTWEEVLPALRNMVAAAHILRRQA